MPGPVFLEGDAITLRPATEEDLPFLSAEWNSPAICATRTDLYPRGDEELRRYLGGRLGREDRSLALLVCVDEEPVGLALLIRERPSDVELRQGELAYWTARDAQEEGYATAGSRSLVRHAFDRLGLHKVRARTFADNDPSRRVLEKLGFREEGVLREEAFVDGEWVDQVYYGLTESEWPAR